MKLLNLACFIGTRQSPIDIITRDTLNQPHLSLETKLKDSRDATIVLDRNKLQVDYTEGGMVFKNNQNVSKWRSLQFHFHAPSEHTIDGKYFAAEMHLVFQGITYPNELAVLGFIFETDSSASPNSFIEGLQIDQLDYPKDTLDGVDVRFSDLLRSVDNSQVFNYMGSLTTPPCTENVQWFVFKETIKISPRQAYRLSSFFELDPNDGKPEGNNRFLADLGSRAVNLIRHSSDKTR